MNALMYRRYGPPRVLQFGEVAKPVPADHQVLIRVQAVSLNSADWRTLRADPFLVRLLYGLFKPKFPILGMDVAGIVEAVGSRVTRFSVGDAVYGSLFASGFGGLAEYACANEDAIALKPKTLSFEEASAIPMAALTALQGLRDAGSILAGQKVLVNGASGGVGTFAVQFAHHWGATVTAVCRTVHADQARALGADHVIDYTRQDFTANGGRYDLILAVNGYHSLKDYRRALSPTGVHVAVGGTNAQLFQSLLWGALVFRRGGKSFRRCETRINSQDLEWVNQQVEKGRLQVVIDRRFPFDQAIEAFRYLGEGHAKGKVVITMKTGSSPLGGS